MKIPAAKLELDTPTVAACSSHIAVVVISKKDGAIVQVKIATRSKGLDVVAQVAKQFSSDHFTFVLCTLSPNCEVSMFDSDVIKANVFGEGVLPMPPGVGHA